MNSSDTVIHAADRMPFDRCAVRYNRGSAKVRQSLQEKEEQKTEAPVRDARSAKGTSTDENNAPSFNMAFYPQLLFTVGCKETASFWTSHAYIFFFLAHESKALARESKLMLRT